MAPRHSAPLLRVEEFAAQTEIPARAAWECGAGDKILAKVLHDPARLEALRKTGLLDSPEDEAFNRFTFLATRLLEAPIASVTLVDDRRQFFKSAVGFPEAVLRARETPLSHSFCKHVVALQEPLVIRDSRQHALVRDNPSVQGGVIAYLGVPLTLPGGETIGSLCVIDGQPREWGQGDVENLQALARLTMTEVALREEIAETAAAQREVAQIVELSLDMIATIGFDGYIQRLNGSFGKMLGYTLSELKAEPLLSFIHPEDRAATEMMTETVAYGCDVPCLENRFRCSDGSYRWLQWACKSLPEARAMYAIARDITEQHQTWEELRVSEARFSLANRGAAAAIWDWNLITNECFYAPRFLEMLGLESADAPMAKTFFSARLHPQDAGRAYWLLAAHLERRQAYDLECRLQVGGGDYRWFQVHGQALWDEEGLAYRIGGSIEDIHERKLAQREAADLSERLTTTLESLSEGFTTIDREWRYTYVNASAERLLHRSRESLLGRVVWDEFPNVEQTVFGQAARTAMETNEASEQAAFFAPLGRWFDLHICPSAHGLTLYFRDITERKETEEALRKTSLGINRVLQQRRHAEEKYRAIFENSTEGLFQNTPEGVMVSANPALARMLGFSSPEELIERRTDLKNQGFAHPDERDEFTRLLEEKGRVDHYEYEVQQKDGTRIWVSESTRIVRDEDGKALYYEGSVHDITERIRAHARLIDLNRQLVDLSRAAGMAEVATSVLHNVGNVLNSANISLEIATSKVGRCNADGLARVAALLQENAGALPEFLSEHPQGRQLGTFLSQLADHLGGERQAVFNELKSLRMHMDHISEIVTRQQNYATAFGVVEILPINSLVEDAIGMNAQKLESEGFIILRDFDEPIPPLPVDRHKLMQILINLLHNARHALAGLPASQRRLTVRTKLEGDLVLKISVADNGVGIPPENLARVFEHGFTTRKTGHGFGLHGSALAAQEMGGRLLVASDGPGQGAVFTLEIPCRNKLTL